jgi:iron complex outermembrane recepter protein
MKHSKILLIAVFIAAVDFSFAQYNDSITLSNVDVTAKLAEGELKRIAGSISVFTVTELEKQDEMLITTHLNSLPGIFMHNGTYNTNRIVIRGIGSRTPYGSNRIRAYLNDIPLTNGDGVTTLEDIDVAQLGRVQVMKGPNSALYGSGLGGTIKLSTREPDRKFGVSYRYGSFNTEKINVDGGIKITKGTLNIAANRTTSDGYRENNRYGKHGLLIAANQQLRNSTLSYTFMFNHIDAHIPSSVNLESFQNTPQKAAANWLAIAGYEENTRAIGGITVQRRINERWSNKTTIFAGYSDAFEKRPFGDLDEQTGNYGARSQFRFQLGKIGALGGIELYNESYHWRTYALNNNTQPTADIDKNRSFSNLFALFNYEQSQQLQFTAGLNLNRLTYRYRGSFNETGRYSYPFIFSPRLGANFELNRFTNLFASVGHGFSHPSLEETLLPEGEKNPDLKPEQGYMYETGFRLTGLQKRLFFDATVYHIALNNMLVTKRITEEIFTGVNAGKTTHSGIELQLSYDIFRLKSFPGVLGFNSSLTLSQNRFAEFNDDDNDYSGKNLPGIPSQTAYAGLNWQPIEKLTANLNYRYTGSQYLNDANSGAIGGYHLTDLKLSCNFAFGKNKIEITGGINNLFNAHYASMLLVNAPSFFNAAPRYYYPGLPRNVFGAIKIRI